MVIGIQEIADLMRGETITVGDVVVVLDRRWLHAFNETMELAEDAEIAGQRLTVLVGQEDL